MASTKQLTRRALLSYEQLRRLTAEAGYQWPDLLIKDYQGIAQDFALIADEVDGTNAAIAETQYPNLLSQIQQLQKQAAGLPEFTMDTTGFTMDSTEWSMDKVIA